MKKCGGFGFGKWGKLYRWTDSGSQVQLATLVPLHSSLGPLYKAFGHPGKKWFLEDESNSCKKKMIILPESLHFYVGAETMYSLFPWVR